MSKQYQVLYIDEHDRAAYHTFRVDDSVTPSSSSLLSALAAMQSFSSASLAGAFEQRPLEYEDPTPASGAPGATTSCVLLFAVSSGIEGATGVFSFPSPAPTCFDADGFVEDPPSSEVAAVIAAVQACVVDDAGNAYGDFLYGWRSTQEAGA